MSTIGAYTGKVKWFNCGKGYGFLSCDGRDTDVFLHAGAVRRAQLDAETLQEGDEMRFDIEEGGKGAKAVNLSRI